MTNIDGAEAPAVPSRPYVTQKSRSTLVPILAALTLFALLGVATVSGLPAGAQGTQIFP